MKNTLKLIVVIALAAIIGISFTSCPEDGNYPAELCYKWFATELQADNPGDSLSIPSFEFKKNGELATLLLNYKYSVSGNVITVKEAATGLVTLGTMKYKISGRSITITESGTATGVSNGTYYRSK